MDRYVLDFAGNPALEPDMAEWGRFMECADQRIVARDMIGGAVVSTVFLGLDHGWGEGAAVLWETMVFGQKDADGDNPMWRYISRAAALAGHAKAVAAVRRGGPID